MPAVTRRRRPTQPSRISLKAAQRRIPRQGQALFTNVPVVTQWAIRPDGRSIEPFTLAHRRPASPYPCSAPLKLHASLGRVRLDAGASDAGKAARTPSLSSLGAGSVYSQPTG